jgi:hypothetical protein
MRGIFTLLSCLSLLLCVAVLILWVRSTFVVDSVLYRRNGPDLGAPNSFQSFELRSIGSSTWFFYWHEWIKPPHGPRPLGKWLFSQKSELIEPPPHARFAARYGPKARQKFSLSFKMSPRYQEFRQPDEMAGGDAVTLASRRLDAAAPHWAVALLFSLMPSYAALRWLRCRRRRGARRCLRCGYDLRASPETCPECGDAVRSDVAAGTRG